MTLSIAVKQNCLYLILIIATSVGSIFLYRNIKEDWIIYREAETKYDNKDYEAAIALYKKSIEAGVPSSRVAVNLANSYVANGNFKEAIVLYKEHLQGYPKDRTVRLELAKALSYTGDYKESEMEFKKALEDDYEKTKAN